MKVFDEQDLEYIAAIRNGGERSEMELLLLNSQLEGLMTAYKDRYDRDNFVKNLLLDNLLLFDIYSRAKKLHIDLNAARCVLTVETDGHENTAAEAIRKILPAKSPDHVTTVEENNIVLVHEIRTEDPEQEMQTLAASVVRAIGEADIDCRAAFGTVVSEIKEVSKSYKESRLALDVSRIFDEDKQIVTYSKLGIGRLVYQLPISLCRMFLGEIFGERSPEDFDEEILTTINRFFENNLNVSETSRQLFIHRNTLVYRLDKLQKTTGLDLRIFEDAITFKIALMVAKYMDYMEKMDY